MVSTKKSPFKGWFFPFLLVFTCILFFVSLLLGRYEIESFDVLKILFSQFFNIETTYEKVMETIIVDIRLPRIAAALLIGAGLAVSGASFQGLFKNPLVSPFILGVASGAGFGASLGILMSLGTIGIQLLAFAFGALAVILTYLISSTYKRNPTLVLILAGVVVSAFFSALISLLKYLADPFDKLPIIVYWLMGSLSTITNEKLFYVSIPIGISLIILMLVRWHINILTLGEEEVKALGNNTNRLRFLIIFCVTVITASAVSISGIIGWVGLVIPHIARMIVGPNYTKLLPASMFLGGCYLLIIDDISRIVSSSEIPLGILTATIGAPVFAYLLRKGKLGWA